MEFAAKLRKPVVVVAPDFKADALTSMVVNHLNGKVKMCAVKTPITDQSGVLSVLHDIAAYTGGTVVS
jgi:chaperonin GroEL (HSP60 family)